MWWFGDPAIDRRKGSLQVKAIFISLLKIPIPFRRFLK